MHRCAALTFLGAYLFAISGICFDNRETFRSLVSNEFKEVAAIISETIQPEDSTGGGHANTMAVNHEWIEPTPSQPQGPFYPIRFPSDIDTDLTTVDDGPQATGTVVYVQGQVMDQEGRVIKNAIVEIWQACASGKYDHPDDPNPTLIDANFQYYGKTQTDERGQYIFKTIVPGPYPASPSWWRPPHIHFKISAPDFKETITQLYFDGSSFPLPVTTIDGRDIGGDEIDQYNNEDLILKKLSPSNREKLIVRFQDVQDIKLGVFNIYLSK